MVIMGTPILFHSLERESLIIKSGPIPAGSPGE